MIKRFNQFINENDSTYINWEEIEEVCLNSKDLLDCIPQNIRQWDVFIRQYERAVDLVNGKWEPHYDWETEEEFEQAVDEQFYLGKGYKHSIYECYDDLHVIGNLSKKNLFKNVDWKIIKTSRKFTAWNLITAGQNITKLSLLPRRVGGKFYCWDNYLISLEGAPNHVGGHFNCDNNNLTSLEGAPNHVGGNFGCSNNNLTSLEGAPNHVGGYFDCSNNNLTSLEGAPNHVGGGFDCSYNKLTSLEGAPNHVGGHFNCSNNNLTSLEGAPNHVGGYFNCYNNNLTSLEGAPNHVGGDFYCSSNNLPKTIPAKFPGKDLPKYINL